MKKRTALIAIACSVALIFVGACSKETEAARLGSYEANVAAYCRAIQSGDYDASVPLTVVGAGALQQVEKGPEFERAARRTEILQTQRSDIERLYRQILPATAQWKILGVGESRIRGTKLVFVEIVYPNRDEADFDNELDPLTMEQIRHHVKKGIYYATVEEKSKLIVDLPNFRAISLYKAIEMWD